MPGNITRRPKKRTGLGAHPACGSDCRKALEIQRNRRGYVRSSGIWMAVLALQLRLTFEAVAAAQRLLPAPRERVARPLARAVSSSMPVLRYSQTRAGAS